jgi:hypothetical protein
MAIYLACAILFAVAFVPIELGYEAGWLLVLVSIWAAVFRAIVVRRDGT